MKYCNAFTVVVCSFVLASCTLIDEIDGFVGPKKVAGHKMLKSPSNNYKVGQLLDSSDQQIIYTPSIDNKAVEADGVSMDETQKMNAELGQLFGQGSNSQGNSYKTFSYKNVRVKHIPLAQLYGEMIKSLEHVPMHELTFIKGHLKDAMIVSSILVADIQTEISSEVSLADLNQQSGMKFERTSTGKAQAKNIAVGYKEYSGVVEMLSDYITRQENRASNN